MPSRTRAGRGIERWGSRRIDEPTPSEIRQLVQHVRANVVPRRNSRGGRSAAEHLIAALRCMYKHAEEDSLIDPADNPARKVEKPCRLPSAVDAGVLVVRPQVQVRSAPPRRADVRAGHGPKEPVCPDDTAGPLTCVAPVK